MECLLCKVSIVAGDTGIELHHMFEEDKCGYYCIPCIEVANAEFYKKYPDVQFVSVSNRSTTSLETESKLSARKLLDFLFGFDIN